MIAYIYADLCVCNCYFKKKKLLYDIILCIIITSVMGI